MSSQLVEYNANNSAKLSGAKSTLIRNGIAGNLEVVAQMIDITRKSIESDKGLEDFVKSPKGNKIFGNGGFSSYDDPALILKAVYDFVKANVNYVSDIAGNIESIKSARQTLSDGYGDCDDQSILIATILGILGYEPFFVLAGYNNENSYSHVYAGVKINGVRYILDTTLPNGTFNDEAKTDNKKEIEVFGYTPELDSLFSVIFYLKKSFRQLHKDSFTAIPIALQMLPTGLGYPLSMAMNTGLGLIANGNNPSSVSIIGSQINRELDQIIAKLYHNQIAIDQAKISASQAGTKLANADHNDKNFSVIYESIKRKIDFINNFDSFAQGNNIHTVKLDGRLMLLTGGIVLAVAGYYTLNRFKVRF